MIANRVWPNATARSTKTPLPSGPRCANARFIAASTAFASGPGPVNPAMPHIAVRSGARCLPPAGRRPALRFRRVLHDPSDLVGRPPARLEIDARLHLGDDPEQQKEDARETDRRGEQRQRRLDQRHLPSEFELQCPAEDGDREDEKTEPELAKELDRPVEGAVDEIYHQE